MLLEDLVGEQKLHVTTTSLIHNYPPPSSTVSVCLAGSPAFSRQLTRPPPCLFHLLSKLRAVVPSPKMCQEFQTGDAPSINELQQDFQQPSSGKGKKAG